MVTKISRQIDNDCTWVIRCQCRSNFQTVVGRSVVDQNDLVVVANKVLGREVYTSNAQIGGPRVMGANGVSHLIVQDDVRGVRGILRWLSYVPRRRGAPLPFSRRRVDPVRRPIGFKLRMVTPGSLVSSKNRERPLWPASGSVLAVMTR